MRIFLIIRNNYVINRIVLEDPEGYVYPYPHDSIIEDVDQSIHVGAWYEESEDIFYMPFTKPNDPNLPEELEHIWE